MRCSHVYKPLSYIHLNASNIWAFYITNIDCGLEILLTGNFSGQLLSKDQVCKIVFNQKSKICCIMGYSRYIKPITKTLILDLGIVLSNLNTKLGIHLYFSLNIHFGPPPVTENTDKEMHLIQHV